MEKIPSVKEIVATLFALPPEQIATVYEFILFLQTRHPQAIDISDSWTEEDLVDLRNASLQYAFWITLPFRLPYIFGDDAS